MSLEKCGSCGNEVSTEATTCPKCGHPRTVAKKMGLLPKIAIGVPVGLIGLALLSSLGWLGVVLGLAAAGGSFWLRSNGPEHLRQHWLKGVGVGVLLALTGARGVQVKSELAVAAAQKEEAAKKEREALAEAEKRKEEQRKREIEAALAPLVGLPATASDVEVTAACVSVTKTVELPPEHRSRCASASAGAARVAVSEKRARDALGLLEQAGKWGADKASTEALVKEATLQAAIGEAEQALTTAQAQRGAGQIQAAQATIQQAAAALQPALAASADSEQLKAISEKVKTLDAEIQADVAIAPQLTMLAKAEECLGQMKEAVGAGEIEKASESRGCVVEQLASVRGGEVPKSISGRVAQLDSGLKKTSQSLTAKKRAARKYINMSPDQFAMGLLQASPTQEFVDRNKEKYVRWPAKYLWKGMMVGELFYAGKYVEMACDTLDEDMGMDTLAPTFKKYQAVSVEGRFLRIAMTGTKTGDKTRAALVFADCSVK